VIIAHRTGRRLPLGNIARVSIDVVAELSAMLGADRVYADRFERAAHARDCWPRAVVAEFGSK